MKVSKQPKLRMLAVILMSTLTSCNDTPQQVTEKPAAPAYYALEDFKSVKKFDTHVHFNTYDTSFLEQAKADNFQLLTINVSPDYYPPIEEQLKIGARLLNLYPERIAFATTFSMKNWNDKDWLHNTFEYLENSFAQGAIAVKVWKHIGMEYKDRDGSFIMIDNPRFDTIFTYLAKRKIPLIGHLGEPKNCWLPVEKMTVSGDKNYFTKYPQYHMYLHPEYPSYEDQINARNHVLQKHPDLQFIGAHLGSLEWSVDELAKHLDKYPHFAVDMAARIPHFQYQAIKEWQKVHDFFIKYQDRLIYATDLQIDTLRTATARNKSAHERWVSHWQFFTTADSIKVSEVEHPFNGLHLPREVIDKIYAKNAEKWFPGINKSMNKLAEIK